MPYAKGHCESLQQRLKQHKAGEAQSTRPYLPFDIIYFEEFRLVLVHE